MSRHLIARCDVLPLAGPAVTPIATQLGVPRHPRPARHRSRTARRVSLAGLVALVGLTACGDGGRVESGPRTYVVDSVDFRFVDLPDEIAAGSRIELTNSAPTELHELVAFRLADDETRSVAEIVEHDPDALFASGPPPLVILTPPDGEPIVALGDGTLSDPGRYAIVCMIPTGVDPGAYLEAVASSDGPPQIPGAGAPHLAHGMFAEVVVVPAVQDS